MTCEQYESLWARSGGRCEICGVRPEALFIDHDATVGWWAVRRLLCVSCNTKLRDEAKTATEKAYMASAWYLTVLVPVPPEPSVGARVAGPFAGEWVHTDSGWRRTRWANCAKPLTWSDMCRKYGAHNLTIDERKGGDHQ